MNKIFKLLLCVFMVISLCGCDSSQEKTYNVRYYDKDGKLYKALQVNEGTYVVDNSGPEVDGYEFVGWSYNEEIVYDLYVEKDIDLVAEYNGIQTILYIQDPEQYVQVGQQGKIEWFTDPENYNGEILVVSSDTSILTIDEKGNCYGISEGTVGVTISNYYSSTFIIVHVIDDTPQIDTFKLISDEFVNLSMNQTHQIQVNSAYASGEEKPVYYGSDDSTVAVVDENGLVKAVGYGQTVIRCFTADGNYGALVFIYVNGATLNAHLADPQKVYGKGDTVELFLEYSIYKNNSCITVNGLTEKNVKLVIDDGPDILSFENNVLKVTGSYGSTLTVHFEIGEYQSNQMFIQIR